MFPPEDDHDEFDYLEDEVHFEDADPASVDTIECWRCGKFFPLAFNHCPACNAPVRRQRAALVLKSTNPPSTRRVLQMLVVFGLLFIPMIGCSAVFLMAEQQPSAETLLQVIVTLEVIDTIIVLIALASIRSPALPDRPSPGTRLAMWFASFPLLVLMIGCNLAYFRMLIDGFGVPVIEDELMSADHLLPWVLLTICVQPAIIEEIFFRQTAMLALRETMGENATIWITGVMFGFAHIGNPLGIPYLILFGVFQGYVRVKSGSLLLPMILHFLHNLAVLYIERMA